MEYLADTVCIKMDTAAITKVILVILEKAGYNYNKVHCEPTCVKTRCRSSEEWTKNLSIIVSLFKD